MSNSCSFRITRTAEDLVQTISSISQRLVKLEQRQEALELQLNQELKEISTEERERLDGVDKLLNECQELLESTLPLPPEDESEWTSDEEPLVA
tara:strand:+ start:143 stop:424 length:282 start_codon:yes stop_codon:yes gene_type:complete